MTADVAELAVVLHRADRDVEVRRWTLRHCTPPNGPVDPTEAQAELDAAERHLEHVRARIERAKAQPA